LHGGGPQVGTDDGEGGGRRIFLMGDQVVCRDGRSLPTSEARMLPASRALATAAGVSSTSENAVQPTIPTAATVAATAQVTAAVRSTSPRRGASTVGSAASRSASRRGTPQAKACDTASRRSVSPIAW
jgi:hypothetical protein